MLELTTLANGELAREAAEAALSKNARDVEILDVADKVDYASYLVLCTANLERHAQAVLDEIQARLGKRGIKPIGVEGTPACRWVLVDYGDVIVHIFLAEVRDYYDLDALWIDADRLCVETEPAAAKKKKK